MTRFRKVGSLVLGSALVLAACGGDDDADPAATPPGTEDTDSTTATEPQSTTEPSSPSSPATTEPTVETTDAPDDPVELSGELVIASWGGISDEASGLFATPFAEATDVAVRFEPVPGQQVAGMQAQSQAGNIQWDLGDALGQDQTAALAAAGLLEELPADVAARLEEALPGAVKPWGINYGSLSNVISCSAAEAQACPSNPAEFFDVENFPGRRTLWADSPLVAMAMALAADGVAYDAIFPMDIDRAFAKLDSIKGEIDVLYSTGDQLEQLFRSGEAVMGILWNGRAYSLSTGDAAAELEMQTSWDGAVYAPTELVVYKDAPNRDAAFAYLEWVANSPDAAREYAELSTYGFPNQLIFESIDPEIGAWLPENPEHFGQRIELDYQWYLENQQEVDDRWVEFTTG